MVKDFKYAFVLCAWGERRRAGIKKLQPDVIGL